MENPACEIKIQRYLKRELAEIHKVSLVTFLKELKPIQKDLEKLGYKKDQKYFSPKQVRLILIHIWGNQE